MILIKTIIKMLALSTSNYSYIVPNSMKGQSRLGVQGIDASIGNKGVTA
jgi:hypothetical protein